MIIGKEGLTMDDVVIVGTAVIDQIMNLRSTFIHNGCNKVDLFTNHGGSMRNVAENCANLNLVVDFISKYGNDDNALSIIDNLNKLNIGVYGPTIDVATPLFVKINGDQEFMFATTTPDFFLNANDNIPVAILKKHKYGITDNHDQEFLSYILKNSDQTKWIISSYIPNKELFHYIDGIILTENEFINHTNNELNYKSNLIRLFDQGLNWVIVTLGDQGCIYMDKGQIFTISTEKKKGNPLGCGDAFASGVIYSLCIDNSLKDAIIFGHKLANLTLDTPYSVVKDLKSRINTLGL